MSWSDAVWLAHIGGGQWYETLLYLAPVVAVAIALWWSSHKVPDDHDAVDEGASERDA